jgi:hypothetical protein
MTSSSLSSARNAELHVEWQQSPGANQGLKVLARLIANALCPMPHAEDAHTQSTTHPRRASHG